MLANGTSPDGRYSVFAGEVAPAIRTVEITYSDKSKISLATRAQRFIQIDQPARGAAVAVRLKSRASSLSCNLADNDTNTWVCL